ncbi:hypothetical protein [Luteimonas fraxinea]|uniref:Uncharacterized protein n=1 Tax=Luteimonas fraxinea TaxID=2901869 RepID=A0ABS8U9Q9_9GAMM|nr:hypothetical protein [Luteimonas fraxinea]MCD9096208.1 hypothetical protein [Luteimonas fraxinea]
MTGEYAHRCMIVAAQHVAFARALAVHLEPVSAQGMFPCPLSPTGEEPATHYCSSGMVGVEFVPLLTDAEALYGAAMYAGNTGASLPNKGAQPYALADCVALVETADVSEEDPHAAFERMGLKMVEAYAAD